MSQYIIVYLGGNQPATPEEGKQHFAKYMEWLSSLGDSAISPANPLKNTSTVNSDGTVTAGGYIDDVRLHYRRSRIYGRRTIDCERMPVS